MKRKWVIFLVVVLTSQICLAQKPEEALHRLAAISPIEKVYLHLDRDNYVAGGTIWFKSYLYSEFLPDTISTTLYVELMDGASNIISQKVLPVFFGHTNGQLELPDSLNTGNYFIRAYSPTMLNQDPDFIYKRSVYIYGKNKSQSITKEKKIRMEFFPEGGNAIAGLSNTIAFKATDENGMPVTVKGIIRNSKNDSVSAFDTYHDGMGMFDLNAIANEKYSAILQGDNDGKSFPLPLVTTQGLVFKLIPHPEGSFFEIDQLPDPAFQAAYMIGQMQHHIVFRKDFTAAKNELSGVINTLNLASGIMQVTVFNKAGMPLAERLCFINNKEYIKPVEITTDTIDFTAKAKNRFSIVFKDTVQGSFSVSVSDPDYNLFPVREENIYSGLLLSADLKGYIHQPSYYFSGDNDSVKTALDLVMMINGWRRFNWTALMNNPPAFGKYKDPAYITLSGKVTLKDSNRPFTEKQLLVFISGADSVQSMQMTNTDKQGYFRLDSILFYGRSRVVFSDVRGKKSQYIEIKMSPDSLNKKFLLPVMQWPAVSTGNSALAERTAKMQNDYDAIMKENGLLLEGIVVKSKKKSAVQELDDKYASGMFSGFSEKTLDLTNTKEVMTQDNIFDYLQYRVPGLNVQKDGLDYSIFYRQTPTASMLGAIPMLIYLNEIETDAEVISTIPANQVAMVKVFSSFAGSVGNGAGGVLAVYTKKGADMNNVLPSVTDQEHYNGYSIIKEFYSPDYIVNPDEKNKTDNRITLQWIPDVYVNNVDAKIPIFFYNNDRTKSYRIIVEGMTKDGKMVSIEKIISPAHKAF